jgi:hypothetical protein
MVSFRPEFSTIASKWSADLHYSAIWGGMERLFGSIDNGTDARLYASDPFGGGSDLISSHWDLKKKSTRTATTKPKQTSRERLMRSK